MDALFQHHSFDHLELALSSISHVNSCSMGVYIPIGSRHETPGQAGISHFIEHMIFKGTETRSVSEIAVYSESKGITMNAYTTEDHTLLEMRGLASTFPQMTELMADMLWYSTFPDIEVANEAKVIQEEIIEYQESPTEHIYDLLSSALWPNHSLAKPITGTLDSVSSMSKKAICDFHQQHYKNNISVAIAGNLSLDSISSEIIKFQPSAITKKINPIQAPSSKPISITEHRQTDQAHIAFGYPTQGRLSQDRHALRMISLMLGETMSSILFQKIREELGLCYTIQSEVSLYEDIGSFNIVTALNAEKYQQAIEVIHTTLAHFVSIGPTADMLENAKRFALIQNQLALEGSQAYMQWIGDSITCYNRIITPDEAQQSITDVTMDQIMRILESTFHQDFATACILPEED